MEIKPDQNWINDDDDDEKIRIALVFGTRAMQTLSRTQRHGSNISSTNKY